LDRLYEHWQREPMPCFVFLTRGERRPVTAESSASHWRPLTWQRVAAIVRAAASDGIEVAPGVHDYLTTLEVYHDA